MKSSTWFSNSGKETNSFIPASARTVAWKVQSKYDEFSRSHTDKNLFKKRGKKILKDKKFYNLNQWVFK